MFAAFVCFGQKRFLRSRWLDQVIWMGDKAAQSRDRYYRFRLSAIVLGVIVPILVGLGPVDSQECSSPSATATVSSTSMISFPALLKYSTIVLSGIVAASAAVEEFFHYGERWYHYRRTVESLKSQGWQYFELCGPYRRYDTHKQAFSIFADQIEEIIQRDVEVYATQMVKQEESIKLREEDKQPQTEQVPYRPINQTDASCS